MNSSSLLTALGDKILLAQQKAGLTNQMLADAMKVSSRQIQRMYRGEAMWTIENLRQIENILGTTIFDLNLSHSSPTKHQTMSITKESMEFSARILSWCLKNGITDHEKIEELFNLILAGLGGGSSEAEEDFEEGSRYRSLRNAKGLSLREVAQSVGLSPGVIGRFERSGSDTGGVAAKLDQFYESK